MLQVSTTVQKEVVLMEDNVKMDIRLSPATAKKLDLPETDAKLVSDHTSYSASLVMMKEPDIQETHVRQLTTWVVQLNRKQELW